MDIKTYFGNQVLTRRKKSGLTQPALAKLAGMTKMNIIRIEQGTNATNIEKAYKFCAIFGCQPNDLFPSLKKKK